MQILFVVPYPPSLIRVRPYNLIRHLSERGHQVTVATLWTTGEERDATEALREHCHEVVAVHLPRWRPVVNCVQALPSDIPLQVAYSWHPALAETITSRQQHVDVVHVEHLRGARYALLATRQNGHRSAVVWDSVDCITHLFEQAAQKSRSLKGRLMTRLEVDRTRQYEAWLARRLQRVLVTSPADRDAFYRMTDTDSPITVLPNGVDLAYFSPNGESREPATVVYTGKMSYHANVSAALHLVDDVMPLVWAQRPEVTVWIVGKDPTREVRALAETRLGSTGRVVVTGTVPDIRPYLWRATVAVAPVPYGAGIQNKVLEAMACGTPVVASPQATSALAVNEDRDLVSAGTPEAFADAILALLQQPQRQRRLGQAGRAYVETFHSWAGIAARLESIYESARAEAH